MAPIEPDDLLNSAANRRRSLIRSIVMGVAVCLLMMGVVFRAVAAGDFLWLDEQHTAWVAKSDLSEVAARAADGNQTPLFFYATWAALKFGGQSGLALRLPALVCGLVMLFGVSTCVYRRMCCTASLLLVVAYFALDYDAVFYASEARPYALVQLLGVIQAAVFYAWVSSLFENGGDQSTLKKGVATAILAALIFYTHPTGMLLMVAELVFVLGVCIWQLMMGRRWFPWRALVGTALLCAGLILPGVITIGFVWQRRENWASVTDAQQVFGSLLSSAGLMVVLPLMMLLLDTVLNWRAGEGDRSEGRWGYPLAFVACWAIVPKLLIVAIDAVGWVSLAIGRYAIVGEIAFALFAAFAVAAMRRDCIKWITTLAIVGWIAFTSPVPWQLGAGGFRHENWKQVVEIINGEDKSLPVFLVANLIEDKWAQTDQTERFQRYLGFPLQGIPGVVFPERIFPRPSQGEILSPENVAVMIERGGGLVVVRDAEVYRDAIRLEILSVLQKQKRTESAKLFLAPIDRPSPNNVHLFLIKLR